MEDLGPAPTPRLEPIRSEDRRPDTEEHQKRKPAVRRVEKSKRENAPDTDFVNDGDPHTLDERA